ncbi:hypothetical protein [Pseudomonas sp. 1121_17]|uniref:hypothetical protein n=1 Tax=Pseudomonas sp. 1121_17 TaxID=2604458 RepID=UPI0040648914
MSLHRKLNERERMAYASVARLERERDDLRAQLAERDALLTDLGVEPKEVSDIYQKVLKDAERYQLVRERLSVDDFPNPHPEWSTPTESESSRIDELCDAALSASAEPTAAIEIDHDALVAAVCVLRSQGLGNLSQAVEVARAALERKRY